MLLPEEYKERVIKSIDPREQARLNILSFFHCYVLKNGKVLIWRKQNGKTIWSVYGNIKKAISAQKHIRKKNQKELSGIFQKLNLISEAKKPEKERRSNKELKKEINKLIKDLEKSRDNHKRKTATMMEATQRPDKLGRDNPGVKATQLTSSETSLQRREKDVKRINFFIERRYEALLLEEKEMELKKTLVQLQLADLLREINNFFPENITERQKKKEKLNELIEKTIYFLQGLWLNPYLPDADNTLRLLTVAKDANRANDLFNCRRYLALATIPFKQ
jgi:hypothetical protein